MGKKNPAAVALGKLAASRRTKEELAEAGRRGGLAKAAKRARNGTPDERTTPVEVADQPDSKNKKPKKLASKDRAIQVLKCAEDVC